MDWRRFEKIRRSRRFAARLLVIAALVSGLLIKAWADTVYFNDGGKPIRGTIESLSAQQVNLRLKDGTLLPLNREAVRHIEFGDTPSNSEPELDSNPSQTPPVLTPLHPRPTGLVFPNAQNRLEYDENSFIVLSTFKGAHSHTLYAGLYKFSGKDTLWVRLPRVNANARTLRFSLYGKFSKNKETETFTLKARYLDQYGNVLQESPMTSFSDIRLSDSSDDTDWFEYLEGITGLVGEQQVEWTVPPQTKTIAFQVTDSSWSGRHLVGYLSNLMVSD